MCYFVSLFLSVMLNAFIYSSSIWVFCCEILFPSECSKYNSLDWANQTNFDFFPSF